MMIKIWFEILKEFMIENAKGFANTNDFFNKGVMKKLGLIIGILPNNIFIHQISHSLNIIKLTIDFYFKWNNVNDNFIMPLDLLVNGNEIRVYPTNIFNLLK